MSPAAKDVSVTLLWGEDEFLLRERALDLLGELKPTEVDGGEWQGHELQDLATPSLFGEPRALLITDAKSLPETHTVRRASASSVPTTTVFVAGSLPIAYAGLPVETPSPRRWPGVNRQKPRWDARVVPCSSTIRPSCPPRPWRSRKSR